METFKAILYWALYVPRFIKNVIWNVWGNLAKKLVGWNDNFKNSLLATLIIMSPTFVIPLFVDKKLEAIGLCVVFFLFSFPLMWVSSYSEN